MHTVQICSVTPLICRLLPSLRQVLACSSLAFVKRLTLMNILESIPHCFSVPFRLILQRTFVLSNIASFILCLLVFCGVHSLNLLQVLLINLVLPFLMVQSLVLFLHGILILCCVCLLLLEMILAVIRSSMAPYVSLICLAMVLTFLTLIPL